MFPINNIRFVGGVLLVAGTTIGAGMLALPVITSFGGFFPSVVALLGCWLIMLCSAFFFLDVNLSVRGEPNLISMAGRTLGVSGKVATWLFYLLLLYSLLAAYIAASAPLFEKAFLSLSGYPLPVSIGRFSLPLIFGSFIYLGTRGVDYVNRLLMIGLGLSYVLLVAFVPSHIDFSLLKHIDFSASLLSLPVLFTSFGYHIIIPSLTTYLNHDRKLLRQVIICGSILPIAIYLSWQLLVLGVVPQGYLSQSWIQGVAATEPLSVILNNPYIAKGALIFSFFAIVTSFLGISLSLSDFLTDGLKIKKSWEGRLLAFGLTFIPPLVFVFTYERGFYLALQYAGVLVAILLGILPSLMAWRLKGNAFYSSIKGRSLILLVIALCLGVIVIDFLEKKGALHSLITEYLPK